MKYSFYALAFSLLWVLPACQSSTSDLAFVNDVKTFEPKWMDLSETLSYIGRNILVTDNRYNKDLSDIKAATKGAAIGDMEDLLRQYRNMTTMQHEIKKRYENQKELFTKSVHAYNDFENKVMKNKLSLDKAKKNFENFKQQYEDLAEDITKSHADIVRNIEEHNALTRKMVQVSGTYTNFDIDPR